jgi:hypothetical protein
VRFDRPLTGGLRPHNWGWGVWDRRLTAIQRAHSQLHQECCRCLLSLAAATSQGLFSHDSWARPAPADDVSAHAGGRKVGVVVREGMGTGLVRACLRL